MNFSFEMSLAGRLRQAVSLAWGVFREQVGHGRLSIHKEASMQLHYSYLLKGIMPMVLHRPGEDAAIELETGVTVDGRAREMDLKLVGWDRDSTYTVAVEMKCYRRLASSGKPRGAQDIFRKDVYEDLALLERYCALGHADVGVSLVMTDYASLVHPKSKESKSHDYDIAHGARFEGGTITTPIGGKDVEISLSSAYDFEWVQVDEFFFAEVQGA